MATGQYIGVNGVARKVTTPYIGVNGVARNVTSGYVGVNGVARLFFVPTPTGPIILEVEKITSNTYANDTTYNNEEFILLDIYPKTGGTVSVTYGGLAKTITDTSGAEKPNAQEVFFGTFNGVSDSVTTPSSGELTIEGDYRAFSVGTYAKSSKSSSNPCGCITAVTDFGSIAVLPNDAFNSCASIVSLIIPDGVTSIGLGAFTSCTGLKSLTIPKSVRSIGAYNASASISNDDTFSGCAALKDIFVDEANEHYDVEGGALFNKDKSCLIAYPAVSGGYTIPNTVTEIWECAFSGTALTSVTIPEGVTSIDDAAFYDCTGLTSLTIPSTVTKIGGLAFYGCNGLLEITILATTPPTLDGSSVFPTDAPIYVPAGCGDTYKAADGWSTYANYIVEAS